MGLVWLGKAGANGRRFPKHPPEHPRSRFLPRGNKEAAARVDHIAPESVAAIRAKLKLSQTEFSNAFGISPAMLRNWEQGRCQPTCAARVLLRVAAKPTKVVLDAVC